MARAIHLRIEQLTFATNVEDLVINKIGRCHALTADLQGRYAMHLVEPFRLVFSIRNEEIQIAIIEQIVDYH